MKNIALDGPLNGRYITPAQAVANGYYLINWQPGEQAYQHFSVKIDKELPPQAQ